MLQVTCAIIQKEDKILICQRSEKMKLPLKWEFPGGKIEEGESKKECLKREIKEELNVDIDVLKELKTVKHHYSDFSICLYPFLCQIESGILKASEHAQIKWVTKDELRPYDWAEADIPIVAEIETNLFKKES